MKKKYWLAAYLSLGMMACGGDDKKDSADNDKYKLEAPSEAEPIADYEQTSDIVIDLGGNKYDINIKRCPDRSLPLVVDELEQRFYDNRVDVKILRDNLPFLSKKVTKEDFVKFLSKSDYKSGMLLGMNCDTARCDKSTICFTAQVGQAGEGPAFLVLVPTGGGEIKVSRDETQDEISYNDLGKES